MTVLKQIYACVLPNPNFRWAPVFPLAAGRTLEVFPSWFSRPVPNSAAEWNVGKFSKWRSKMVEDGGLSDPAVFTASAQYPSLPEAAATVTELLAAGQPGGGGASNGSCSLRVVIEPGDLVLFSAAHLHRSTPNSTSLCRFSTEARTVLRSDFVARKGAPDVDGGGGTPKTAWFKGVADGDPLAPKRSPKEML
jgi:hypothetical protein